MRQRNLVSLGALGVLAVISWAALSLAVQNTSSKTCDRRRRQCLRSRRLQLNRQPPYLVRPGVNRICREPGSCWRMFLCNALRRMPTRNS